MIYRTGNGLCKIKKKNIYRIGILLILLICFFLKYIIFGISYLIYALQLYCIGTDRYTIIIDDKNMTKIGNIPYIIHQTYKNFIDIPLKWKNTSESCRSIHNDTTIWKHMFWTDESGREFIKNHFSEKDLINYDSYKYPIQRADALRYFILYYYGGIYIDLDVGCLLPLDKMQITKYPFVLASTFPIGFSNDFMVSEKGHPFLKLLIDRLEYYNQWCISYYITIIFSTGPMFITINYINYMNNISDYYNIEKFIYIINSTLYGSSSINNEKQLFYHVEGNSWHNNNINK